MTKRTIEVFTAGCPCCDDTVKQVQAEACPSCEVLVLDMRGDTAAQVKAKQYGITRVPTVVINGKVADCCTSGPVDIVQLRGLGLGVA